jgi:hypothetical protein
MSGAARPCPAQLPSTTATSRARPSTNTPSVKSLSTKSLQVTIFIKTIKMFYYVVKFKVNFFTATSYVFEAKQTSSKLTATGQNLIL